MKEIYKSLLDPKGKFGMWGIVAIIIIGVTLMVLPSLFIKETEYPIQEQADKSLSEDIDVTVNSLVNIENSLAKRATSILSQIEGVGNVSVFITMASGPEHDYAKNITNQKSTIEEQDSGGGTRITNETDEKSEFVFTQGQGEPLILKEKGAQVKGILVVADGAKDVSIKATLSRAVQSMFDLPAHKVTILPKESR
ncbi:MAG: hypothetical protein PHI90_08940 [Clostridia bacterium]|nr:hypothetical protein [Clostridia bacterium]MDD4048924.1 hypothetical protein [Clostridia bacterium]